MYVKSQPTITITNGVLRGDPTGCSRLTGVTLTPNTLCPFVGETLTVKCTGEGVTVMKDRVSLNVSTLVQVITGTENTGNYSCGDGGPCDPAQTSRPVVVYSMCCPPSRTLTHKPPLHFSDLPNYNSPSHLSTPAFQYSTHFPFH